MKLSKILVLFVVSSIACCHQVDALPRTGRSNGHDHAEKINRKDQCSHLENPNGEHKLHAMDGFMCCGCGPGQRVARPCKLDEYHSTKCEPCESGTYIDEFAHNLRKCKVDTRKSCPDPNHVFIASTLISPTRCICAPGFFGSESGLCKPHRKCEPGWGVWKLGNHTHDTECVHCSHGLEAPNYSSIEECVPTAAVRSDPRNRHLFTDERNFVTSQPEKSHTTALKETTSFDGLVDARLNSVMEMNKTFEAVRCHLCEHCLRSDANGLELFKAFAIAFLAVIFIVWAFRKRIAGFMRKFGCFLPKTDKEKEPADEPLLQQPPQPDDNRNSDEVNERADRHHPNGAAVEREQLDQLTEDGDDHENEDATPGSSTSRRNLRVPHQKLSDGEDGGITEPSSQSAQFIQEVNEVKSTSTPSFTESHEMTCQASPSLQPAPRANHDTAIPCPQTNEYFPKMNNVKIELSNVMDEDAFKRFYRHFSKDTSSHQETYLKNLESNHAHSVTDRFCVAFDDLRNTLGPENFNPRTIEEYFSKIGHLGLVEIMKHTS